MGINLDPDTSISVICAIAVGLAFGLMALALNGTAAGRRYKRRLNSVYDRAQGVASEFVRSRRQGRLAGRLCFDFGAAQS